MAEFVLTDASVTVNAVDLSGKVRKATVKTSADDQDATAMGATWKARRGGLKDSTVSLEFNQDFAAANVDATLWAALGTNVTVVVKPTSGALSATNPGFSGSMLLKEYSPIDGEVGSMATAGAEFVGAGTLSRLTA